MPGTALSNFADFVKVTGPAYFTSAEQFLNEAVNQTYALPRFLKGKGYNKVIQSGATIKDDVMFDEANTYQRYKPNQEFTWSQPQVVTEQEINWRFSLDHMSWTDQEVELNMDDGYTRSHAKVQYKNMRRKIEARMWTSMLNGMEADLWASPHTAAVEAEMEQADGIEAYSLGAFISENTTDFHPAGWTTIMGIDPATESKWRNQVSTYEETAPYTIGTTPGDDASVIQAFDDMWLKVRFIPPQFHQEHFESINMQAFRQGIFCSRHGMNIYKTALREENDTLVSKQDAAYNNIQYSGIDLVYIAQLDGTRSDGAGAIYANDNTIVAYDEDGLNAAGDAVGSALTGRRWWFVNGNYLTPIFHSKRYFYKKDPYTLEKQPFTWVTPVDCWNNLFCHSRQRQGIIAPKD